MIYLVRGIKMSHPFIDERSTAKRFKKLILVDKQTNVKQLGGKGNSYQYTKTGVRADLGDITFRSGWEADFARILTVHRIPFQFEPTTYKFPIQRGTKSYTPDFYLPGTDEFIELKGWFDDTSRIKLKRWKKYYPAEFSKLHVIISKYNKKAQKVCEDLGVPNVMYFQDLMKEYDWINNWESRR